MRRSLSLSLAVVAFASATLPAGAAASSEPGASARARASVFEPGLYGGRTHQGLRVSFRVSRNRVTRFTYSLRFRCDDGDRVTLNLPSLPAFSLRRDSFRVLFRNSERTNAVRLIGGLSRRQARGTVEQAFRGRDENGASYVCESGVVRFSARRVGR